VTIHATRPEAAAQIAFPWIVRLRYAMAAGQVATALVAAYLLHIDLPLAAIFPFPILIAASNLLLVRRNNAASLVEWVFALDTLCLSGLLMLTGGPSNPFSLLYLVHITLAATILTKRQTWLLGGLSTLCFGLLFWIYRPIPALELHHHGDGPDYHLIGMWIGFAVATFLVAMFSGKISELLREREASLLAMQTELAKKERLSSLVTLAAGAAHELSTPLATIAVVAKELERYATTVRNDPSLASESRLIRAEVDRCREILRRMRAEGAEPAGEASENVEVGDLLQAVESRFPGALVEFETPTLPPLRVPRHAVEQALIALVKNAMEAGPASAPVRISATRAGDFVRFAVIDHGPGMPAEALRRIGEPFFTTKEPGKGMGLGVFLVRTLAERLGGTLKYDSQQQSGTSAMLELPLTR
jgi:two-component system, sensor histidine kinase RegB